jgi:hypothetical protein
VLPEIILVALPAVVVVEEGIHVLELVGNFGRRLSCPVVVEPLISVVLVFPCFYQLAEDLPYICVKVFCHFLLLIHLLSFVTTVHALCPPERRGFFLADYPPRSSSALAKPSSVSR